ncbi:MAG: hypothetical protein KC668_30515, partial [Myxococcales bacterium]|nr:hypothetical protein [Myxococcales bacterium]
VLVGGNFLNVAGQSRAHLAAFDANGLLLPWNPSPDDTVRAIAVSDTTTYVAGAFTALGSGTFTTPRRRLAAFDASGALTPWNPDADGAVHALALGPDAVYVGGAFTALSSSLIVPVSRPRLAAVTFGGVVLPLRASVVGQVDALAWAGGRLMVGGTFLSIDGELRDHIGAFESDGTLSSWAPHANDRVTTLASAPSGVFVGGAFTSLAGARRSMVAAVHADGTLSDWAPRVDGPVYALAEAGGDILLGGAFG